MVHELRQIQQWVGAREEKLSRLEGVWRSAGGLSPACDQASLLGHMQVLQRIKSDLDGDVSLISMHQHESAFAHHESPAKAPLPFQPKQALSPERASRGTGGHGHTEYDGMDMKYSYAGAGAGRSKSPPRFERAEPMAVTHAPANPQPSSTVFASRLGSGGSGAPPAAGAHIKEYSNSLRSSLNAYDLHAE
jgi:hypothetical protein